MGTCELKPSKGRLKPNSCIVDHCNQALPDKVFYQRAKVCVRCSRESAVWCGGQLVRFCHLCRRFQDLAEFDDNKRSCRRTLSAHNARRRLARALGAGAAVPQRGGGEHQCSASDSGSRDPPEGLVPCARRQSPTGSLLGKRSTRGAAASRCARQEIRPSVSSKGAASATVFSVQPVEAVPREDCPLTLQEDPLLLQQLLQEPSPVLACPQPRPGSSVSNTVASSALAGVSTCSGAASPPAELVLPSGSAQPANTAQAVSPGVSCQGPAGLTLPAQAAAAPAAAPAAAEGSVEYMDSIDFKEMLRWLPGLLEVPPVPMAQVEAPSLPTSARASGERAPTLEEALGSLQLFLHQSSEEELALRGKDGGPGGRAAAASAALAAASRLAPADAAAPAPPSLVRAGLATGAGLDMTMPAQQALLERLYSTQALFQHQQQQRQFGSEKGEGGGLPEAPGMPRQQAASPATVQHKPVSCCWQTALPGVLGRDLVASPFQSSCWDPSPPLLGLEQQHVLPPAYPGLGQGSIWPVQPVSAGACAWQGQQPALGWPMLPQACTTSL